MNDLSENCDSTVKELVSREAPKKRVTMRKRLAIAGTVLALLFLACACFLRGTLLWPISTHLKVTFAKDRMVAESTTIPRVNGVYFEISNNTKERHQLVAVEAGSPFTTKGFIRDWQPLHRDAGKTVEPGQSGSYQGIYVYESPLATGRRFLLFCNEPGHYERGESAVLVVK
jgi:hypothetical protein